MRNAWKGLVVGALTGAAAGIAIDLVDATARTAQHGAAKAADAVSGHSSEHARESEHPKEATRIRNAWKGLVVGGLTGTAAGIAIDFFDATARTAQRGAATAAGAVSTHLPEAIDKTKEAATRATHFVADRAPDVAGALTDAASGIAIDLLDATFRTAQRGAATAAGAVSTHLPEAIDKTKEAATRATHFVADKAPDIAESAHKTAKAALDRQRHEHNLTGRGKRKSR
jgi:hypothetical protein